MAPIRLLGRNLGTFLLAFALALLVWVSAVLSADPNEECVISANLEVIGQDTNLLFLGSIPNSVEVQVRSLQSICTRMGEDPAAISAIVDLSALGEGEHVIPVDVSISAAYSPYRDLSVEPQDVSFRLEPLLSRTLPIQFNVIGEAAPGYRASTPIWDTSRVTISGQKSIVERVTEARVTLDILDAEEEFEDVLDVVLLDEEGNPVTGIDVEPSEVGVTLPIERLGTFRDVTVKVLYVGQPAEGYRLTNITPTPQVVTLFASDPELLRDLPGFVETVPIDLTDATDDIERRVALVLPDGVSIYGEIGQSVIVQVGIAAIETSATRTVSVDVIGLAPGYEVVLSPDTVDVVLVGPTLMFEELFPEDVRVVLDLTGFEPGLHTIAPQVDILPQEVRMESILPVTIEVNIMLPPTVTPTPTLSQTITTTVTGPTITPTPLITPTPAP